MTWALLVRIIHVVGTVLGVGGATFAELFSSRIAKSGKFDDTAGNFFAVTYKWLRVGEFLVALSGFGFFLINRLEGHAERIYSDRMWLKVLLLVIIMVNAVLLQTKKIPFWLGSAISITSWYWALVLGIWRGIEYSFTQQFIGYIVSVFVVSLLLQIKRKKEA